MSRKSLGALFAAAVSLAAFGEGRVICVDGKAAAGGDGSAEAPYQTIAEGVAAAQNHDVVELVSGIHTVAAKVVIDKPITVRGDHAAVTVVRPAADGILVFQLNHADAVLEGVTVRDAKVSGSCSAVQVSKGTLQDAIICNNTCTGDRIYTGAVWVGSASSVVRRCTFTDNVGVWGGAVLLNATGCTLDCCHLTRNKALYGGGIYINKGGYNPKVVHVTATGNTATAGSGGPDLYNESGASVTDFHDCYAVSVYGSIGGANNIIGRSAKADDLRNAGAPVEGMSTIDVDGVPYDAETPSIGCRALVDDPVSVVWTGPTEINIGETYTVSGLVTGVPEGTAARCDLYASDGTWVAGSDTDELTFTVGTIPGAYTLVVGLSDGEMTRKLVRTGVALAGLGTVHVSKTGSGTFPYGDEATAFTDIQTAIDACANGGTVIVHDGTYAISSTILVEKGVTVKSANGRDATRLERATGAGCRPLYINHPAALVDGFTIAKGKQSDPNPTGGIANGGGVLIGKLGGTLDRCLVEQCVQSNDGGALVMLSADAYVRRTILRDNEGRYGGAVYLPASSGGGTLESCLIYRNKASWGGGLYSDATGVSVLVVNCTILDNTQTSGGENIYDYGSTRSVMCVNSICTQTGVKSTTKCLTTAAFVDRAGANYMLAVGSTAIDAGASREDLSATDVAGNPRVSGEGVDVGAYEYRVGELKVDVSVDVKTAPYAAGMAFVLTPTLDGVQGTVSLDWTIARGDGAVVLNRTTAAEPLTFEPTAPGVFSVKVVATDGERTAEFELAAMFKASAAEVFVGEAGGNVYPYASAADAATDINVAWDMAGEGTVVHVAEGRYALSKTLNFDRGITLIGAGRDRTVLASSAEVNARVATLNHAGAAIRGCTLTGARIGNPSGRDGAGVYFGAKGGLLEDCRVTDNISQVRMNGGGVSFVAGSKGVVRRCEIDHNSISASETNGGGIYMNGGGTLESCLIHHNSAAYGGGVFLYDAASLTNCTIVANSPNLYCEHSWDKSSIVNTICGLPGENGVCVYVGLIQDNPEAQKAAAQAELAKLSKPFYNCLSSGCYCFMSRGDSKSHPLPEEKGNLTGTAAFVDSAHGDYRLSIKSPCRGAGLLDAWMLGAKDLDGNRRAYPGLVDMGCYQRIPKGLMLLVK